VSERIVRRARSLRALVALRGCVVRVRAAPEEKSGARPMVPPTSSAVACAATVRS